MKRGQTAPWKARYVWDNGIKGTIACVSQESAELAAARIRRSAALQGREVTVEVFNTTQQEKASTRGEAVQRAEATAKAYEAHAATCREGSAEEAANLDEAAKCHAIASGLATAGGHSMKVSDLNGTHIGRVGTITPDVSAPPQVVHGVIYRVFHVAGRTLVGFDEGNTWGWPPDIEITLQPDMKTTPTLIGRD